MIRTRFANRSRAVLGRGIIVLLGLLLVAGTAMAAGDGLRAWLDRDTVRLGETFTLNIEREGAVTGAPEPDFSPLERDFIRIDASSSRQVSMVNGVTTAKTLWAVALEPRTAGVLTVPSLALGSAARTGPLTVTVLPAPAGGEAGGEAMLEIEAAPSDPYVQQEVRYTVRLLWRVDLAPGAQLEAPAPANARIQQLGNDASFQTERGGQRYNALERRYVLLPERSGELRIAGPRFVGRVQDPRYGLFGGGRQISARGEDVLLTVRPRPDGGAGDWLPARAMEITLDVAVPPGGLRVGEPFDATLVLRAEGLDGEALPDLDLPVIDGADVYPDQAERRTGASGAGIGGELRRRFAIVPRRAGTLALPGLSQDWWNTTTDQAATATLAARTVDVQPAAATATGASGSAIGTSDGTALSDAAPPERAVVIELWIWRTLAVVAAAVGLFAWAWRRRGRRQGTPLAELPPGPRLRRALQTRDASGLAVAIREEVRRRGGHGTHLRALADQLDDPAQAEAIRAMETARWTGQALDWGTLESVLRRPLALRPSAARAAVDAPLPPLYPGAPPSP